SHAARFSICGVFAGSGLMVRASSPGSRLLPDAAQHGPLLQLPHAAAGAGIEYAGGKQRPLLPDFCRPDVPEVVWQPVASYSSAPPTLAASLLPLRPALLGDADHTSVPLLSSARALLCTFLI